VPHLASKEEAEALVGPEPAPSSDTPSTPVTPGSTRWRGRWQCERGGQNSPAACPQCAPAVKGEGKGKGKGKGKRAAVQLV
jgi:hypothetical protein